MVSILPSSVVDIGFRSLLGQTKDYTTGICYFSTKQAALKNLNDLLPHVKNHMFKLK
jgi:hypothetical protein